MTRCLRAFGSQAKDPTYMSFFILETILIVAGVIILTQLLLPQRPRSRNEKGWEGNAPPAYIPLDAVWQPVAATRFRFYVYSAYLEQRTRVHAIRIIAVTKTRHPDKVVCRLWLPNNRTATLKARVKTIRENWNLGYSAAYVLCYFTGAGVQPQEASGAAVSVISANYQTRPPTNKLNILDTRPKSGIEDTMHICVKPFHMSYSRRDWLVEWFEFNIILGIRHFYMYNSSLSPVADCLLNYYKKQGLVTVLSWKLPVLSKVEIRTEGQFAAFNDCLYRSMSSAGWLLVIDVDELVIPYSGERLLPALLMSLRRQYKQSGRGPSAYLFRNVFYYLSWEDDPTATVPLTTALKTRRRATPHPYKFRSKYVVKPSEAVELGNHFVWELVPGSFSVGVPPSRGLMHHYRLECEHGEMNCLTVPSTVDRAAHPFANELNKRVNQRKKELGTVCPV